jgi:hypothetical protein
MTRRRDKGTRGCSAETTSSQPLLDDVDVGALPCVRRFGNASGLTDAIVRRSIGRCRARGVAEAACRRRCVVGEVVKPDVQDAAGGAGGDVRLSCMPAIVHCWSRRMNTWLIRKSPFVGEPL